MNSLDQNSEQNYNNLLTELGENYHYLKTIISNKIELTKLEFLQKIGSLVSLLIFSLFALFLGLIIMGLSVAALVIYIESLIGSFLTATLIAIAIVFIISMLSFYILKPKITLLVAHALMDSITNENTKDDKG